MRRGDMGESRGSYREKDLSALRTKSYRMRVNDFELQKLNDFAKRLGVSKSSAIFKAIDYYEENAYGKR
jgi:hypothetical protein